MKKSQFFLLFSLSLLTLVKLYPASAEAIDDEAFEHYQPETIEFEYPHENPKIQRPIKEQHLLAVLPEKKEYSEEEREARTQEEQAFKTAYENQKAPQNLTTPTIPNISENNAKELQKQKDIEFVRNFREIWKTQDMNAINKFLKNNKAQIDAFDHDHWLSPNGGIVRPLITTVAAYDTLEMLKALLENGANPNAAPDKKHNLVSLDTALFRSRFDPEKQYLLLKHGANIPDFDAIERFNSKTFFSNQISLKAFHEWKELVKTTQEKIAREKQDYKLTMKQVIAKKPKLFNPFANEVASYLDIPTEIQQHNQRAEAKAGQATPGFHYMNIGFSNRH
jgi:hypothetical protein